MICLDPGLGRPTHVPGDSKLLALGSQSHLRVLLLILGKEDEEEVGEGDRQTTNVVAAAVARHSCDNLDLCCQSLETNLSPM